MKRWLRERVLSPWITYRLPPRSSNSILLTFDDGPDVDTTPPVLDLLATYDVRAVFFLIGNRAIKHQPLVRRIIAEGHVVGNHSFDHRQAPLSSAAWLSDLGKCQQGIYDAAGVMPTVFRPPFGKVRPASIRAAHHFQLSVMCWSLDVNDWRSRSAADAQSAADGIIATVRPRDILLLHDDNAQLPATLAAILPELSQRFDLASGISRLRCNHNPNLHR